MAMENMSQQNEKLTAAEASIYKVQIVDVTGTYGMGLISRGGIQNRRDANSDQCLGGDRGWRGGAQSPS